MKLSYLFHHLYSLLFLELQFHRTILIYQQKEKGRFCNVSSFWKWQIPNNFFIYDFAIFHTVYVFIYRLFWLLFCWWFFTSFWHPTFSIHMVCFCERIHFQIFSMICNSSSNTIINCCIKSILLFWACVNTFWLNSNTDCAYYQTIAASPHSFFRNGISFKTFFEESNSVTPEIGAIWNEPLYTAVKL